MNEIARTQKSVDSYIQQEKNRGRIETRTVHRYRVNETIKQAWPEARSVIYLRRQREIKGESVLTESYYLSSLNKPAKDFFEGVRQHWGIENRLHYVKDVSLTEDASKIRSGNAPQILSLIRNLVINVIRLKGENNIKRTIRRNTGNLKLLKSLLE
jgi:predicted transposase YbfD/YdcC